MPERRQRPVGFPECIGGHEQPGGPFEVGAARHRRRGHDHDGLAGSVFGDEAQPVTSQRQVSRNMQEIAVVTMNDGDVDFLALDGD